MAKDESNDHVAAPDHEGRSHLGKRPIARHEVAALSALPFAKQGREVHVRGVRGLPLASVLVGLTLVVGLLVIRGGSPAAPSAGLPPGVRADITPATAPTFATMTTVDLPGDVFDLAYDPVRNSLWFANIDTNAALYRYDIATGALTSWPLPTTVGEYGYGGRVAVAPDGSVWISEEYRVTRVDPTSNAVRTHTFPQADTDATPNALDPNNPLAGTWPTAIAFDSQGMALIARLNVKSLTRMDASLSILDRIPLPAGLTGPGDLVDSNGVIYAAPYEGFGQGVLFSEKGVLIGKTPKSVARLSVSGTEVATIGEPGLSRVGADASMTQWRAVQAGNPANDRMALADGGAAVYEYGFGCVEWISPSGDVLARFLLARWSIQHGVPGGTPLTEFGMDQVSALAADKAGSIWYVDRTARQLVHVTM